MSISVIIPVYNVKPLLARCLDSLLAQSFTDWEAICVDDGSTDGSGALLEAYAEKDARIRVVHQSNAGPGAARNNGMNHCRGEYCLFADSDDFLHPQLMEICHHLITRDHADLVAYTYNRSYHKRRFLSQGTARPVRFPVYDLSKIRSKSVPDLFDWVSEYSLKSLLRHGRWAVKHCQAWRCLYRTETIRDIRFPDGISIYEDLPWWGEVLLHVGKATILNLPLYYYSPNRKSLIHASSQQRRVQCLREVIARSEQYYAAHASARQRAIWEKEFLTPFRKKLKKKERRLKAQTR